MPRCAHCQKTRPVHDFNIERARPSGCQAYCRRCHREKIKEHTHRRRESPEFRRAEVDRQVERYWREPEYRARKIARTRAVHALNRGDLKPEPCRCGNPHAEMHHEDYSKPLEVSWLCRACHLREHHGPDLLEVSDSEDDLIADLLRKHDARRLKKAVPQNENQRGRVA